MKRNIVLIALCCLLISASAVAEQLPSGAFPYGLLELRGHAMEMSRDGKFRIYSGATTFVEGSFRIDGNRLTISDSGGLYACRGEGMNPGSYYWVARDHKLYLMLIRDNCAARRAAFVEAPLKIFP